MHSEMNGLANNSYACFDDKRDMMKRDWQECNNLGMWKQGTNALVDFNDWINDFAVSQYMKKSPASRGLKWSDELGFSASEYVGSL
jgi:hypothetical protein